MSTHLSEDVAEVYQPPKFSQGSGVIKSGLGVFQRYYVQRSYLTEENILAQWIKSDDLFL